MNFTMEKQAVYIVIQVVQVKSKPPNTEKNLKDEHFNNLSMLRCCASLMKF